MKRNKLISVFIIAIIAILMLSVALGSVQAVDAAPKKVKITWNANGGKIGTANTKATTVIKGKKIGKLPKTPTKVGYTFKGWYTKKSGGTKITKATKVKKKVTYHAQWKKGSSTSNTASNRILTATEKELVGKYSYGTSSGGYWAYYNYNYNQWKDGFTYANGIKFNSDGTFESFSFASGSAYYRGGSLIKTTANWHITNKGTVYFTNYVENVQYNDGTKEVWRQSEHPNWNSKYSYTFDVKDGKNGIMWMGSFYQKE